MRIHIRWTIRKDIPEILTIEQNNFSNPYNEDALIRFLRQKSCISLSAEYGEKIVGYVMYELQKDKIIIINISVDKSFQRKGIGETLMNKMKSKVEAGRRKKIELVVRDDNYDAHYFFQKMGFVASQVIKQPYHEIDNDAYQFVWRREWAEKIVQKELKC